MKKPILFALAIVMAFSMVLFAGKRPAVHETYLVTTFDFARYPACDFGQSANCILSIRFYDADSTRRLAQVDTMAMRGPQRIVATVNSGTLPHRAYAVTVYLDGGGGRKEGPPGQATELRVPGGAN